MTAYPIEIKNISKKLFGRPCLYVLEVEPGIYKYGITNHIQKRLRTHYKDMKFVRIVEVYDCIYRPIHRQVENLIGKFAKNKGEKIRKYDKTEIIQTEDIGQYLGLIENKIDEFALIPQTQIGNVVPEIAIDMMTITKQKIPKLAKKVQKITCQDCKKEFGGLQVFQRHKNRKTPCIIKEVPLEHINNPNLCKQCNKLFTNIGNLNKHLKTCIVKNVDIKVKPENLEQKIIILQEQRKQQHHQINQLTEEMARIKQLLNIHLQNTNQL